MGFPGWNSLPDVVRWEHLLRSAGWYLFAGGIFAEVAALFVKKSRPKHIIEIAGIACFVLMLCAERVEYTYQDRNEALNAESSAAAASAATATQKRLEAQLSDASASSARLARLQRPRLLDAKERTLLADRLNGVEKSSLVVIWVQGDSETEAFGKSLIEAVKPKVLNVGGLVAEMDDPTSPITAGVALEVPNLAHPTKLALTLFDFFRDKGLEPKLLQNKDKARAEDGWITVRIRPRPTSL